MENARLLKSVFIFRDLSQIELAQFNKVMKPVDVTAGQTVLEEGGDPSEMFFILDGRFDVLKGIDGEQRQIAELGEGEHFGEMGLIDDHPRSAGVRAATDGKLVSLGRDEFRSILDEFPAARVKIYENFLESLCERLRSSNENLLMAAHASPD